MVDLYQQLVKDHIVLSRVLETLDNAVSHYDEEDSIYPSLPLILDALTYIQSYPEVFHHPLEELAFTYLQQHNLGDQQVITEIRQQHRELEQETAYLSQQFNAIVNDCVVPLDTLKPRFDAFIKAQMHHLHTENQKIFPTLKALPESAWWDIASGIAIHQDPLFNEEPTRQSFNSLAEYILAPSSAD